MNKKGDVCYNEISCTFCRQNMLYRIGIYGFHSKIACLFDSKIADYFK